MVVPILVYMRFKGVAPSQHTGNISKLRLPQVRRAVDQRQSMRLSVRLLGASTPKLKSGTKHTCGEKLVGGFFQ